MFLFFPAYVGGILTILSPCIFPILLFVFARFDQPFRKGGLPFLLEMALTFALGASLSTIGGRAIRANQYGRLVAGKSIPFRVTIDGKSPGADHGVDTDAEGYGIVTEDPLSANSAAWLNSRPHLADRVSYSSRSGVLFTFG